MAENVTNELIYATLKTMQGQLSRLQSDVLEIRERLGFLEQQYARISHRVDKMDERLHRVERRLDIVDDVVPAG